MKRVHILGRRQSVFSRHLHPVRIHRRRLSDLGLKVEYFSNPRDRGIEDCDVLIFMEGSYRDILPLKKKDRPNSISYLQQFFGKFNRVIWFDDHDSSGMLRTYVLPFVDVYAKSQLMVDKNFYQENHLIGVSHRDFVHESYGVDDKNIFKGAISDAEISKLKLAWNLGLINWGYVNSSSKLCKLYRYIAAHKLDARTDNPRISGRSIHVACRVGMHLHMPTVHWWRKKTEDLLHGISLQYPQYRICHREKVASRLYHLEMKDTVVTPSPFGMGEICYRDFECFMNGSLLLKPRMDHLESYPDLYVEGETYVSFSWDFSDFQEKLLAILSDPIRYEHIAIEGRRRFVQAYNDGEAFARRFESVTGG